MRALLTLFVCALMFGTSAYAQPKKMERSIPKQREAVAAWTTCIADENKDEVAVLLSADFRTDEYRDAMKELAEKRVSADCFKAMPRSYRSIKLGGLPFVGGLAERMIGQDEKPLLNRLSMAAIGPSGETFSYTDVVAMCTTRGAPHLVANLFDSAINSDAETKALADLMPVISVCSSKEAKIEASPLAMRSILATASYRLLIAQKADDDA